MQNYPAAISTPHPIPKIDTNLATLTRTTPYKSM